MAFDVVAARSSGYSDKEIYDYLNGYYDVDSATKAGYSLEEIGGSIKFEDEPIPESQWNASVQGLGIPKQQVEPPIAAPEPTPLPEQPKAGFVGGLVEPEGSVVKFFQP